MSVFSGDQILLANSPDAIALYFGDCVGSFDHIVDIQLILMVMMLLSCLSRV